MSSSNIVVEWLRSLHLGQYAESFLDNGYDDLEICKQVGEPDLDAIGVFNTTHRARLLQSVRTLREEGAASVYFTLEESQAIQEECKGESSSRSDKGSSGGGSAQELPRYLDEYEEGKAELSRMPRSQIRSLVREKLRQEGIRLSGQPYSTATGDRGYLEGLAGRYSEVIGAYGEVLNVLEELRLEEWAQLSPRFRVINTKVNQQGSLTRQAGLVTSLSQPIYVPGKYSPSSCLSDREEDEIYGFTGYQNAQPQQPIYGACKAPRTPTRQPQPQLPQHQPYQINKHNYQNWLNPRSAYFYELPPSERPKKRASLIRFLRHLKTGRKDKNASRTNHRVGTPEDGPINSPVDYDKMRLLQKSSRTITFEETIHRLKVQEAMKKKEKIDRDHEEFLREIRAGVLVGACSAPCSTSRNDDTYMYDEDSARLGQHWYDEPPYESDPEDFLMSDTPSAGPHARLCFAMGAANDQLGAESEVISLRSAGDISLPHHQRAILVPPQRGLRGANRESGDYAASDVNSICSRLSSLSMETSRSEHLEIMDVYHRLRPYNGTEPPISPGHSSDYADQEELMGIQAAQASSSSTVQRLRAKCNAEMGSSGKSLGRRHHHHHHHHHHHVHHRHRHPHHSSAESLPSASSTQALVNNMDDYSPQGPALPLARALVDSSPNLYDKEALRFKKGDIIEVMSMSSSGLWRGRAHNRTGHFKFINVELLSGAGVPHHQGGHLLEEDSKSDVAARRSGNGVSRAPQQPSTSVEGSVTSGCANRPTTLEQMLQAIHMEEHMSLFVLNGFEDLDSFCEIREEDLDYLGINDPENRAKILAAVQVLHEFEQEEESWNNEPNSAEISTKEANNFSQQNSTHALSVGSEKMNMIDDHRPSFLPNIPVITSNCDEPPPLPAPEGGGGLFIGAGSIISGGGSTAASGANTSGDSSLSKGGGGGSEKSSDSGVSSSSGSSSGGRSAASAAGSHSRPLSSSRGRPPPPPPPPKPSPPPSYVNQIPAVSTPSD